MAPGLSPATTAEMSPPLSLWRDRLVAPLWPNVAGGNGLGCRLVEEIEPALRANVSLRPPAPEAPGSTPAVQERERDQVLGLTEAERHTLQNLKRQPGCRRPIRLQPAGLSGHVA